MIRVLVIGKPNLDIKKIIKSYENIEVYINYNEITHLENYDIILINDISKIALNKIKKIIDKNDDSLYILTSLYKYLFNNKYNYKLIYSDVSSDNIINEKIEELLKQKTVQFVKKKIFEELEKLHFNFSYVGTKYLIDAILILYFQEAENDNLKSCVYPLIAEKYHKDVNNIKCNIMYSTQNMFFDCDEKTIIEYLNLPYMIKPTPKQVIKEVLNRI